MRVLVTGGTGFIGRALTAALLERRDEVVIVSRGTSSRGVSWADLDEEVGRADAVVHLAGEPVAGGRWTRARLERIRTSRVETTERIAEAIAKAERKPRVFVSGSAIGFYGMRMDDQRLDESSPAGDGALASIVVAWEGAAVAAKDCTRVVHPRIGIVLGRGGGALESMTTPFKWFVGGSIGTGKQWMSWIHLHDAVRALLFAIDRAELAGGFNVTAPVPVDMDTFAKTLGRALGRPSALRVPSIALRMALGSGFAQVLLTGQRVTPRKLVDAGFAFTSPRLDAALDAIFRPA